MALRFAVAVSARRDELRVGDDANRYAGRRWEDELPESPYAVYLAGVDGRFRTLALDLDAPAAEAARQARAVSERLAAAGIEHVTCVSGPSGRRHVLATFIESLNPVLVRSVAVALRDGFAPALDLTPVSNGRTGCIRPPLAAHRNGGVSVPDGCLVEALRVLEAANPASGLTRLAGLLGVAAGVAAAPVTVPGRRPVSAPVLDLLWRGDGTCGDRSATAAAVTLGLVEAGYSFQEYLALVLDDATAGLDHVRA